MLDVLYHLHGLLTLILIILIIIKIIGYYAIVLSENKTKKVSSTSKFEGKIDIIIAAYNEEKVIIRTLQNLLKIKYNKFGILVVDDGSTDTTLDLLQQNFSNHPKIKILSQSNGGKAEALASALAHSSAEVVTFIDADTHVQDDILNVVSECFADQEIAAMSGYLKVQNLCNMLTIGQNMEYITTFNFEREVFDKMNTLTTIPGAICAFKRKHLLRVGGFKNETITEDCDVTIKLLKANLKVNNEKRAVAYTEAPLSVRMFIRQRIRWDYGLIQNLVKHGVAEGVTSFRIRLVFFYCWFYKIAYTILFALADLLFIVLLVKGAQMDYYLYFLITETLLFLFVLKKQAEAIEGSTFLFVFYRVFYRHLKSISLTISICKLISRKELQWKKIRRTSSI